MASNSETITRTCAAVDCASSLDGKRSNVWYCSPRCRNNQGMRNRRAAKPEQYAETTRKWRAANPGKGADAQRRWRQNHNEQYEEYRLSSWLSRHGLTLQQFEQLLSSQDSKCAICGVDGPGGRGMWHIDHDHSCTLHPVRNSCDKCRRGLLCSSCNLAIGLLKDDPSIMASAIQYLSKDRRVD